MQKNKMWFLPPLAAALLCACGGTDDASTSSAPTDDVERLTLEEEDDDDAPYTPFAVGPDGPGTSDEPAEDDEDVARDTVSVGETTYPVSALGAPPEMTHCALSLELGVTYQGATGVEQLHVDLDVYGYEVGEEPLTIEIPSSGAWGGGVRCVADDCFGAESAWLSDATGTITVRDVGETWQLSDVSLTFENTSDGQPVTVQVAYAEVVDPY